jgi:hypothetical protein
MKKSDGQGPRRGYRLNTLLFGSVPASRKPRDARNALSYQAVSG